MSAWWLVYPPYPYPYYAPPYPPYPPYAGLPPAYELQLLEMQKAQIEATIRMLNEQLRAINARIEALRRTLAQQGEPAPPQP